MKALPEAHYRAVAEVYVEAVEAREPVGARGGIATNLAVAETWGVPVTTAARWVKEAFRRGYVDKTVAEQVRTNSPLQSARIAKGLGLRELARIVGIDPAHLSRIESGKAVPSVSVLLRLAEVLGLAEVVASLRGILATSSGECEGIQR